MYDTDHLTNRILSSDLLYVQYRKTSIAPNIHRSHAHSGYELYYFQGGKATYIIEDSIYHLVPGDMLLFRGELLHHVKPASNTNYVRSIVNFDLTQLCMEEFFGRTFVEVMQSPGGVIVHWDQREQSMIDGIFATLQEEERSIRIGRTEMIRARLTALLIIIMRKLSDSQQNEVYVQPISQRQANIERVLKVIKQQYRDKFSLDQLAEEVHLSKHYLCHCFKQVTGLTVNQYVLSLRMEEGKRLLLETSKPVGVISEEVGVGGLTQFCRLFRQKEGISPKEFRKNRQRKCSRS